MPTVEFEGETVECEQGAVLRDVLLENNLTPHSGLAKTLNCSGNATCGTCAVLVEGATGEATMNEARRLQFRRKDDGARLACQCTVEGDVVVERP